MNAATKLPGEMGAIHFVGIGGIGMSGIAEVLLNHGYLGQGICFFLLLVIDDLFRGIVHEPFIT